MPWCSSTGRHPSRGTPWRPCRRCPAAGWPSTSSPGAAGRPGLRRRPIRSGAGRGVFSRPGRAARPSGAGPPVRRSPGRRSSVGSPAHVDAGARPRCATPSSTMALSPCSAPKPDPTSRDSIGSTKTCRTTRPKMIAAMTIPPGTLAKNETISRISEVSGISTRPLKNMWMAKAHSADRCLTVLGAVEELLVEDAAVLDPVGHPEEPPGDGRRLHDHQHSDRVRKEPIRLHDSPFRRLRGAESWEWLVRDSRQG